MMNKIIISGFILICFGVTGLSQNNSQDTLDLKLKFFIGKQVINANDENEKQIMERLSFRRCNW